MPLTDVAIRQAKGGDKSFKLSDGGGLHLLVTPTGSKLRRLGYGKDEATVHGFRATASTILNQSLSSHPDVLERQLAHVEANDVRRA